MSWNGSPGTPDRIFAGIPYLVPLAFATARFGGPTLKVIPGLEGLIAPILVPVSIVYSLDPTGGLLIFFAAFLFVVRNDRVKHFIRYNTFQAILLMLLVTLATFAIDLFLSPLLGAISLGSVVTLLGNVVFLGVLAACVFSAIQCGRGLYADLPVVSEAARSQIF